jgi:drug/metabolite transporter (DMT)-like permease
MMKQVHPSMNRITAVFWMLSFAGSFNLAMSFMKLLESSNTTTVVFIRFLFALAFTIPALVKSPVAFVKTGNLKLAIVSAVLRSGAILCTYYVYAHLPIAFAASIGFTGPFIAVILALLLLRERVTAHKWIAVILGYAGVLIMINPQDASVNIAIVVSLIANLLGALASVFIKKLSKTDSNLQIMFYTNSLSLLMFGVILIFMWQTPSLKDLPLIVLIGLSGTLSQYSFIRAIRAADISFVAPFEYIRLLFAVPIGLLLFHEYPTPMSIFGALIIVACSAFLTYKELQIQAKQQLQEAV